MKKINTKVIQAAIGFTVLQPFLFADASPIMAAEVNLKASEDKSIYLSTHYNTGADNAGTHYIGLAYQGDGTDGNMTAYLKFDLTSLGPGAQIQSAKLKVPLRDMDNTSKTPIINVWGSNDDSWTESGSKLVTKSDTIKLNDSITDISTPREYIVTDFVKQQILEGDMKASFVLEGWTTSTFGPYNPGDYVYSFVGFADRTGAGYPELIITYSSNSAPSQINLSNNSVAENSTVGQVVGTLSAIDADADETATFSIVSGDTDSFDISGNQLVTKKVFDFETKSSYSVGIRVTDKSNNTLDKTFTINVTDVNEAPTGSITINNAAPASNSNVVTLHLTASDPENDIMQVQFSENGVDWGSWESYSTMKSWTFENGDGLKTVYMRLRDDKSLPSPVYSDGILVDTNPPDGALVINSGEIVTNNSTVTLHLTGSDANGPLEIRLSEGGTQTGWVGYPATNTYSWPLSAGDGLKTIKLELRDAVGNIKEVTKTITLDKTPPVITVNGAENGKATNQDVTISFAGDETATLNGQVITNGKVVTEEGDYHLIVTDLAGNTSTFSFTIDKTPPTATFAINNGKSTTKSTVVNLTLTDVAGAPTEMRIKNGDGSWSGWDSFDANKTWTLEPDADSKGTVTVELKDAAGNTSTYSDSINIDTVAPTGSISINGGATHTNNTSVTLDVTGSDANGEVQVRFAKGGGEYTAWKTVNGTLTESWILPTGDGTKTVEMELQDEAGNVGTFSDTIVLDTTKPVITGVVEGESYDSDVTITFTEGTATLNGQPYISGTPVTEEGSYTLVVTDEAGNTTTITFTVDKTKPMGTFTIAGGKPFTNDANVTLAISYDQDTTEMQFSNDNIAWSNWETVKETTNWTLESTDGMKEVYLRLRDKAHNESALLKQSITLDTQDPTGSISINGGAAYTNSETVTLDLTGSDENGNVQMSLLKADGNWTDWENVKPTMDWTVGDTDGTKTVKMQLKDQADNLATFQDTIILDKTGPTVTGVSNNGLYNTNVTITFEMGATAVLDGSPFASGSNVSVEGVHNLLVTDEAGNTTTINFRIDKTKPTGSLLINGGATHTTSQAITLDITGEDDQPGDVWMRFSNNGTDWNDDWVKVKPTEDWTLDTGEGTKTVYMEIKDGAGNIESYSDTIVLDTTKPVVTGVVEGESYQSDVTISFTEGTATLNGHPYASGTSITEEGSYTLVVTDEAGNTTTITFMIDKTAPTSEVSIQGGDPFTSSSNVDLSISNVQNGDFMRFANEDMVWSGWIPAATSHEWNLSTGDGTKTVYMEVKDQANNLHSSSDTIVLDTLKPTGSLSINAGAAVTNQTDVTLTVTAQDEKGTPSIRFSNDGITWSQWETASATQPFPVPWTLGDNGETQTVTMEVRDAAGNIQSYTDTIQMDKTAPTVTGVLDGHSYKEDVTVTFTEGTATLNGQPYVSGTIIDEEGTYTLEVTDEVGNKTTIRFTVDKTAPAGTLSINNGAAATNTTDVRLKLSGVTETGSMRFSHDGSSWGEDDWVPINTTVDWTLETGDGTKIVYMELRDKAGNTSSANASILLDTVAPMVSGVTEDQLANADVTITFNEGTATLNGQPFTSGETVTEDDDYTLIVTDEAGNQTTVHFTLDKNAPNGTFRINNGASATNKKNVTLNLDGVKGPAKMRISNDGTTWTGWEDVAASTPWELEDGDGVKTVYVEIRDQALNVQSITDTIRLDTAPPSVQGVTDGEEYEEPVTITFSEGTATLNGEPFRSGGSVRAGGEYTLVVTDGAGNQTIVRFKIKQEEVEITGSLSINNDEPITTSRDVVLSIDVEAGSYTGDIFMRFSNDNQDWSDWQPYASTFEWKLDKKFGLKTVFMEVKDEEENIVATAKDTIRYESDSTDTYVYGEEDETLHFSASDFVYEGELKEIKITSLPNHGELQLNDKKVRSGREMEADEINQLVFVPDRDWNGETKLGWAGRSEGEEYASPSHIMISLDPVNDAPNAQNVRLTTRGDKSVSGSFKASDVDKDALSFRIVDQPESGRVKVNAKNGRFSFYPEEGHYEPVTFTYEAFDGDLASDEATVTVVNREESKERDDRDNDDRDDDRNTNDNENKDNRIVDVGGAEDKQVVIAGARLAEGDKTLVIDIDDERMNQWTKNDPSQRMSIISLVSVPTIKLTFKAKSIENLQQAKKGIDLVTEQGVYHLPLELVDLQQIRFELAGQASVNDMTLSVVVTQTSDEAVGKIKTALGNSPAMTIVPVEGFRITGNTGNQSVEINQFHQYVQSRVTLPVVNGKAATAVMLLPDGTIQPVPTKIVQENGKQVAVINSMISGDLAFITNERPFLDMGRHWAATEVNDLASRLIVNGVDESHFAPDRRINRAEFTAVLARGLGLWIPDVKGNFQDVTDQDWFFRPVTTAASYGIVDDTGISMFRPTEEISRLEAMVLISRAMKVIGLQTTLTHAEIDEILGSYSDSKRIDSWAREAVALCIKSGIVVGNRNQLAPESTMTRAQMATMIVRLLQKADYL